MPAPLSSLRLLILSPPPRLPNSPSPFPSLLHALTGTLATQDQAASGFAGYTSHPPLQLRTKYYDADVGIWCDEVPLPLPSPQAFTYRPEPETFRGVPDSGETEIGTASTVTPTMSDHQPGETEEDNHHRGLPNSTGGTEAGDLASATEAAAIAPPNKIAEVSTTPPSLSAWRTTMLSEPAQEVRQAIGGIILVLPLPPPPPSIPDSVSTAPRKQHHSDSHGCYLDVIEAVAAVRDLIEDERPGRDVPAVVLVTSTTSPGKADVEATTDRLEELVQEERGILGWEFVAWDDGEVAAVAGTSTRARNDYGELVGLERVRELLEAVDWSAENENDVEQWSAPSTGLPGKRQGLDLDLGFLSAGNDDEDGDGDFGPADPIKLQGQELEREMMGLKLAMMRREHEHDPDEHGEHDTHTASSHAIEEDEDDDEEDLKIDALPTLLERVVAIRDAGAEMAKAEREKFARREIERIMKELT